MRGSVRKLLQRRRRELIIGALTGAVVLGSIFAASPLGLQPAEPSAEAGAIVSVADGQLLAGDRVWTPVGYNDYRLTSIEEGYVCDTETGAISDERLAQRLERVRAAGANVIRTWFFQPYWDPDRDGSGEWESFDRVVVAAAERGIRVIPVLANHWADCEAGAAEKDLAFYAGGFGYPYGGAALSYLDYVREVAGRYAESPTVAFWQLANEPEAPSGGLCDQPAAANALASFATQSAAAIRSVDPNHLISLGASGGGQCGPVGTDYELIHDAVDICELHVYDAALLGLPARIAACEAAGKPTVAAEIGIAADVDVFGRRTGIVSESSLQYRAEVLQRSLRSLFAVGLDGFAVWGLADQAPSPESADPYEVGPCDPLEAVTRGFGSVGAATMPETCG